MSRGETKVGDNGNFLAYAHIAHDCLVGRNVTMANLATLGGHCDVGDFVNFGGFAAVHQFCRIGHHAFVAGMSGIYGDVIPYGMAEGRRAPLRGFNIIGMKRAGMSRAEIQALRRAYRMIFDRSRPLSENLGPAALEFADWPSVLDIIDFLRNRNKRPFVVPTTDDVADDDSGDGDDDI
jgi:UDP-N-acetylglucosamine acyltransferase